MGARSSRDSHRARSALYRNAAIGQRPAAAPICVAYPPETSLNVLTTSASLLAWCCIFSAAAAACSTRGSVVLGHFIHLADRLIDLFNPVALLLAGRGHIAGYLLHGRDDLIHRLAGMIDQLAAGFDFQSARLQSSR